jgi:hypothetical protein
MNIKVVLFLGFRQAASGRREIDETMTQGLSIPFDIPLYFDITVVVEFPVFSSPLKKEYWLKAENQ